MSVIEEIAVERRRQIEAEGWTPEHDDVHGGGQMAMAAACYTMAAQAPEWLRKNFDATHPPRFWPWSHKWWKPKDPRRDLIRAAALIVAEIERLDRAAPPCGACGGTGMQTEWVESIPACQSECHVCGGTGRVEAPAPFEVGTLPCPKCQPSDSKTEEEVNG